MPDANGNLTPDDQNKVRDWFAKHWKGAVSCPVCKTNGWTTGQHVLQASRFASDAHLAGVIVYPYVPVECNNCGHTLLFNAVKMGVVSAAPPIPQHIGITSPLAKYLYPNAAPNWLKGGGNG